MLEGTAVPTVKKPVLPYRVDVVDVPFPYGADENETGPDGMLEASTAAVVAVTVTAAVTVTVDGARQPAVTGPSDTG